MILFNQVNSKIQIILIIGGTFGIPLFSYIKSPVTMSLVYALNLFVEVNKTQ